MPALVPGGKERADVAEPGRAEQGVDERVGDHVAVGVAGEATRVLDLDAAEDERDALLERMRVEAEADRGAQTASAPAARRATDADRRGRRLVEVPPRAAADVHRNHAGSERRLDVVVDAVADVGDLLCVDAGLLGDPLEERGRRLLHAETLGGGDEVDVRPHELLVQDRHVADGANAEAAIAKRPQARQGIGVELIVLGGSQRRFDAEPFERAAMRLSARDRRADERHEREAWNAAVVGHALPVARLVDKGLAHVEHDGFQSHDETSSRSAALVTFCSRGSPGTQRTRPPAVSTRAAQSVALAPSRA